MLIVKISFISHKNYNHGINLHLYKSTNAPLMEFAQPNGMLLNTFVSISKSSLIGWSFLSEQFFNVICMTLVQTYKMMIDLQRLRNLFFFQTECYTKMAKLALKWIVTIKHAINYSWYGTKNLHVLFLNPLTW